MKSLDKIKKIMKAKIEKNEKLALIFYIVIGVMIVLCLIRQLMNQDYFNVLLCVLSLFLITIPFIIEKRTKIELPQTLEIIIICFVFFAEILGEIRNFYFYIPVWDTILHTATGCLAASVGFGAIDLINTHVKKISMTPFFVVAVAFCFSMTIAVGWEFFEYGADELLRTDMQKDRVVSEISTVYLDETNTNTPIKLDDIGKTIIYDSKGNELATVDGYLDIGIKDTMKDMFVNMVGAVVFSAFAYLYMKKSDKYKFVEGLVISENISKKSAENNAST